jgi:hypothetical protein
VFDETLQFSIAARFDICAYSLLTPYPGTILWFEMLQRKQIVSFDWDKYDQSHIVYKPAGLSTKQLHQGVMDAYDGFYSASSMLRRFPWDGSRNPANWALYNAFFRKCIVVTRDCQQLIATPTPEPEFAAIPPLLPQKAEWRDLVLAANKT